MAVVLVEEGEEALVVAGRHPEQFNQLPIVALRPLQSGLDDLSKVGLRELAIDKRGVHDGPEALASDHHHVPQLLGARLGFGLRLGGWLRTRLAGERHRVEDFSGQIVRHDVAA
jgi:hypothetical protein